jgi:hypothetical protein
LEIATSLLAFWGTLRHNPSTAALRPETLPGIGRVKRRKPEERQNIFPPDRTTENISMQTEFYA